MEKPQSVRITEFCNKMAAVLNEAQLPFYILEPYVANTLTQVKEAAAVQKQEEMLQYQKSLKEAEKNGITESLQ